MKNGLLAIIACAAMAIPGFAQMGRQQGLIEPNVATEQQLATVPGLKPDAIKALLAARPFANAVELNKFLLGQGLTQEQAMEMYKKMFIHINLNTASAEEIQLIPGAGRKMAHEFDEYRPYADYAKFRKEIGKYVNEAEVARLEQYTFIPINLNTATDEMILAIPGMGNKMLHEFKEYRPYNNIEKFRKEIGKYVSTKEVARFERYVVVK